MATAGLQAVSRIPFLAGLPADLVASLAKGATWTEVPEKAHIFHEGDTPRSVHFLLEGLVEVYCEHHSREIGISLIRTPEPFVLAAVMVEEPYVVSTRALARSSVLSISGSAVRAAAARNPDLAARLSRQLGYEFRHLVHMIRDLKVMNATQRLAVWLLHECAHQGGHRTFVLPIEKRILASHLGLVPEVLSRQFAILQRHGVVVRGPDVVIQDPGALQRIASERDRPE